MRCSLLTLSSYLDRELPPERSGELEAHLIACPRCSTGLGYLREEAERIRALSQAHVPADAEQRLLVTVGLAAERAASGPAMVFDEPLHPYAQLLIASLPSLERKGDFQGIPGVPPSLLDRPSGCPFRTRCPHAFDKCMEEPRLENRVEEPGHLDRCWLSVDEKRRLREATIAGEEEAA